MIFFNQLDVNPFKTTPFLTLSFDYEAQSLNLTMALQNIWSMNVGFSFQRASFKNFTEMLSFRFNPPNGIILVDINFMLQYLPVKVSLYFTAEWIK